MSQGEAWLRLYAAYGPTLTQLFEQQKLAAFRQRMNDFFQSKK